MWSAGFWDLIPLYRQKLHFSLGKAHEGLGRCWRPMKVLKQVLSWALVALVIWLTWNSLSQSSVFPGTRCHYSVLAGQLLRYKERNKEGTISFRYKCHCSFAMTLQNCNSTFKTCPEPSCSAVRHWYYMCCSNFYISMNKKRLAVSATVLSGVWEAAEV